MVLFTLLKDKDFVAMLGKVSDTEIARKFDISQATVKNARKQLNIAPCNIRHTGEIVRKLPEDASELMAEYEELGSLAAVAKKYGASRQAICAKLKRAKMKVEK